MVHSFSRPSENTVMFFSLLEVMPWLENVSFNIQSSDVVSQKLKNPNFKEQKLAKYKNMKAFSTKVSFRALWYFFISFEIS